MRNLLWKYYLEDDVDKFRRLLENAGQGLQYPSKGHTGVSGLSTSFGVAAGSPIGLATPPRTAAKSRKVSGPAGAASVTRGAHTTVSRGELNSRDHAGLTILHRAVSSTAPNAISFALALIEHPAIDLYIQDTESGWTALHRALYFGNITIARAIIARDRADPNGPGGIVSTRAGSSVIKVKDHEGNSPFDVYNATIARRSLQQITEMTGSEDGSQDDAESALGRPGHIANSGDDLAIGDELFVFGSNKNHSLGFGDGDDRQHPEKITLKRPDHLLFRFYREYLESTEGSSDLSQSGVLKSMPKLLAELPTLILNRPVIVQNVTLSKLHSAVLTTDPESNLYMCGFGPGGRLGTGDEVTRSTFVCIEEGGLAGKKVMMVALGQNHTLAVSSEGEVFSWGTSTYGQLGYSLPRPTMRDEEPTCATPRQIFGPLKRETIIGVAASAIHSVAHTSSSLFCWGKNEGQLGLMDSDSRSLAVQPVPRKVGASLFKAPIQMVSAINGATICLLSNHAVCVFTNYGYNYVKFPLHAEFSNYHLRSTALTTRYEATSNHISSITAGGDTIAAISSRGDLFTLNVRKIDSDIPSASTTNPSKIKSALSPPQRIWSLRKGHWDGIRSVGVSENGSVIICTQAGAVWRRVNRTKAKDAFTGAGGLSRKDYKFQRVPGLTKVAAVRSNTFGVYAAIRRDCDVTKSQISIDGQNLWRDIQPLLSIRDIASDLLQDGDAQANKTSPSLRGISNSLKRAVLTSPDLEADISNHLFGQDLRSHDVELRSSVSEVGIPVHGFVLAARSSILRAALAEFRLTNSTSTPDLFFIEQSSPKSLPRVVFQGLDFITIVNLAIYLYTDEVVDVWHFTRHAPKTAFRYRQIRTELMKTAGHLKMGKLESAVRLMREPERQMHLDMSLAIQDPDFFEDGDCIIDLDGSEVTVHSALLRQRCPFFEGLFNGRAAGQWLAGRRQDNQSSVRIDLKHIEPETFHLVLRYLYADIGSELFDEVLSGDIDEFSELVMDVLGVANELMLDRLSQICQEVVSRFGE
jgi:alpha-tubulin suppressor-like RCC1 family protein